MEKEYDDDYRVYKNIFLMPIPFSDRLDLAVLYANKKVKEKIDFRNMLYIFERTGCIFVSSQNNN